MIVSRTFRWVRLEKTVENNGWKRRAAAWTIRTHTATTKIPVCIQLEQLHTRCLSTYTLTRTLSLSHLLILLRHTNTLSRELEQQQHFGSEKTDRLSNKIKRNQSITERKKNIKIQLATLPFAKIKNSYRKWNFFIHQKKKRKEIDPKSHKHTHTHS